MQNGIKWNKQTRAETKDINWERKVGGWSDNKTTSRLQAHLWLAVHTDKISTLWRRPHPQRTARERGEAQTVSVVHFNTLLFTHTHTHTHTDIIMQHQQEDGGTEDKQLEKDGHCQAEALFQPGCLATELVGLKGDELMFVVFRSSSSFNVIYFSYYRLPRRKNTFQSTPAPQPPFWLLVSVWGVCATHWFRFLRTVVFKCKYTISDWSLGSYLCQRKEHKKV